MCGKWKFREDVGNALDMIGLKTSKDENTLTSLAKVILTLKCVISEE